MTHPFVPGAQGSAETQGGLEASARLAFGTTRGPNRIPVVSVGARWLTKGSRRRGYGRGKLHVSAEEVMFVCSWLTKRRTQRGGFAHSGSAVVVTRARLGLPWARSFVVLENEQSYLRLAVPAFGLTKLRRALRASELATVEEVTAWTAPRLPSPRGTRGTGRGRGS